MNWQNVALGVAGVIGVVVALVHGVLIQRFAVRPIVALAVTDRRISSPIRRLVPPLLQFSTFNWFLGGLALIAVAAGLAPGARLAIALLAGSSCLYGALGNLWATRGRHPGGYLYVAACVLIIYGVSG